MNASQQQVFLMTTFKEISNSCNQLVAKWMMSPEVRLSLSMASACLSEDPPELGHAMRHLLNAESDAERPVKARVTSLLKELSHRIPPLNKVPEITVVADPYDALRDVLDRALQQAQSGKGKERHAVGETPFDQQPMATINKQLGSIHGFIFQAHKKSLEATRLPAGRDVAELLGAINYLAGAVIALETWSAKG